MINNLSLTPTDQRKCQFHFLLYNAHFFIETANYSTKFYTNLVFRLLRLVIFQRQGSGIYVWEKKRKQKYVKH